MLYLRLAIFMTNKCKRDRRATEEAFELFFCLTHEQDVLYEALGDDVVVVSDPLVVY